MEKNLVNLNFSDGPAGTVNFGMNFAPDIDRQSPAFLLAARVLRYLESEAVTKSFEVIDGEDVQPSTGRERTLYDA